MCPHLQLNGPPVTGYPAHCLGCRRCCARRNVTLGYAVPDIEPVIICANNTLPAEGNRTAGERAPRNRKKNLQLRTCAETSGADYASGVCKPQRSVGACCD